MAIEIALERNEITSLTPSKVTCRTITGVRPMKDSLYQHELSKVTSASKILELTLDMQMRTYVNSRAYH